MSFRRLGVIVNNLPMESATKTAQRDAMTLDEWNTPDTGDIKHGQWGRTEYLLAQLIDAVNLLRWSQTAKEDTPLPEPVMRPGVDTYQPAPLSPKVIALAAEIEAAQGAHPGPRLPVRTETRGA